MAFEDYKQLFKCFRDLGASRVVIKFLAENDNSKQQIYLGGSFEAIKLLPSNEIRSEPGGKRPNFKAALKFHWLGESGESESAPGAQLILYPDYPEVRLSGFLRGCSIAPSENLQPVPLEQRQHNNGPDGRVLCFGVTPSGSIFCHLAVANSVLARSLIRLQKSDSLTQHGTLWTQQIGTTGNSRHHLLSRLRDIRDSNPHASVRLRSDGSCMAYHARNGGGYTLEALFGIVPNGRSEPDFEGWELKSYGSSRITLMTPEPDAGLYSVEGVEAFVRKYGKPARGNGNTLYFTGQHRANIICPSTGLKIGIRGYDGLSKKIVDVTGGIELIDDKGFVSAAWSFQGLIAHWSRKHASAAYVPYSMSHDEPPSYSYSDPVLLGEGTRFERYLSAIDLGHVVYDPGPKIENANGTRPRVKARSQFRIGVRHLACLYEHFEAVML